MKTIGIICEYNPFHNGHARQLRLARELAGEDCALVCLMSGNYVQRGEPAIFPKAIRAEAALRCGADLVLELPLTAALSSAEGFAAGGVEILSALGCDYLCFGTETDDNNLIMSTAKANLDPAFDALLRAELETGCSYPSARQRVLERLIEAQTPVGADAHVGPEREAQPVPAVGALSERPQGLPPAGTASRPEAVTDELVPQLSVLSRPNDLLAVEYCKAILKQGSPLRPLPIRRTGDYHATELDMESPSATAIRAAIERDCADKQCLSLHARLEACHSGQSEESASSVPGASSWRPAVPACLRGLYQSASVHTMAAGERAVLAILRTLPDAAFEALPFGAEGLWSKLMKNCRRCASTGEIIEATKSKRYTRTRIQRMLLCAVLGLTAADLERRPPYARILGFNDRGRALLREMKTRFPLVNAGERPEDAAYFALECRAADLYSLFSADGPRPGGEEARQRVFCCFGKE